MRSSRPTDTIAQPSASPTDFSWTKDIDLVSKTRFMGPKVQNKENRKRTRSNQYITGPGSLTWVRIRDSK